MKTIGLFFTAICILGLVPAKAQARDKQNMYWVIETNRHQPKTSIVKFYDGDEVIHEQKIQGKRIDIRKLRHRRMLNNMLKEYVYGTERPKVSDQITKNK